MTSHSDDIVNELENKFGGHIKVTDGHVNKDEDTTVRVAIPMGLVLSEEGCLMSEFLNRHADGLTGFRLYMDQFRYPMAAKDALPELFVEATPYHWADIFDFTPTSALIPPTPDEEVQTWLNATRTAIDEIRGWQGACGATAVSLEEAEDLRVWKALMPLERLRYRVALLSGDPLLDELPDHVINDLTHAIEGIYALATTIMGR